MTDRTARVTPAGAVVFLTDTELREIGVNPGDGEVRYAIEDGEIVLKSVSGD